MAATLFDAFLSLILIGLILIVSVCILAFIWALFKAFCVGKKKGGKK